MNEEDKKEYYSVVVAALLHDIGKFMQRTNTVRYDDSVKNMSDELCPKVGPFHTRKHVLYTEQFFWNHTGDFPEWLDFELTKNLASHHHKSVNPLQWIITEADCLSAGLDRFEREKEGVEETDKTESYDWKKIKLDSIFDLISLVKHKPEGKYHYPINPLWEYTTLFPNNRDLQYDYYELWKAFDEVFVKYVPKDNPQNYILKLISILEEYTTFIPSDTREKMHHDISLFDHLKTTAAISACLYLYFKDKNSNLPDRKAIWNYDENAFVIVSGDLGGIQKTLFDMTTQNVKYISKTLRARSFYLSLITKIASKKIQDCCGLTAVNEIMTAGGRFFILLPNIKEYIENAEKAGNEIKKWIFEKFNAELIFNIAVEKDIKIGDLKKDKFEKIFERFSEKAEESKRKPFFENIKNGNIVFKMDFNSDRACQMCCKFPISNDDLCEKCHQLVEIGEALPKGKFLLFSKNSDNPLKWNILDYWFNITDKMPQKLSQTYWAEDIRFLHHDPEKGKSREELLKESSPYPRTFIARYTAKDDDDKILDFEAIAAFAQDKENIGKKFLGLLKADVDRLGLIFRIGLKNEKGPSNFCLSRFSTLSRMMDMFFSGFLNCWFSKHYKEIYTVYAGGDDLFLIGPWDKVIEMSYELRQKFKEYTCNNEDINISAGVELIHSKMPINQSVNLAEDALEKSKKDRDNLTVFGETINWEKFPQYWELGKLLKEKIRNDTSKITSGFVYRILNYKKEADDKNNIFSPLWRPHLIYDMARNLKPKPNEANFEEKERDYKELQEKLLCDENTDSSIWKNIKIPVSYAIYKNRRDE